MFNFHCTLNQVRYRKCDVIHGFYGNNMRMFLLPFDTGNNWRVVFIWIADPIEYILHGCVLFQYDIFDKITQFETYFPAIEKFSIANPGFRCQTSIRLNHIHACTCVYHWHNPYDSPLVFGFENCAKLWPCHQRKYSIISNDNSKTPNTYLTWIQLFKKKLAFHRSVDRKTIRFQTRKTYYIIAYRYTYVTLKIKHTDKDIDCISICDANTDWRLKMKWKKKLWWNRANEMMLYERS